MDTFISFVTRQRLLVLLLALVVVGLGLAAWKRLPIDAFPDVTNVQVMLLTDAPGLSPLDVERQITFPIEIAMNGLPRVREVRSLSKATFSQVIVVFEDDVDIYFARQLVFERLAGVRERLPEGLEPELGPVSTGLGEIYQYTLRSDKRGPMELRTLQDWVVGLQLKTIPGVNEVNSFGGFVKQYHVLVDPDALLKYGVPLHDVVEAVAANNANAGGSFILKGWEQAYVRSVGLIRGRQDIEEIVLRAKDGTPVLLRDVARVQVGSQTRQGAVTRDGEGEAVAGMVIMLKGENSKEVVDRVKARIPAIQATLPRDVTIDTFYDRTSLIQACVKTVSSALFIGGLLVIAVLIIFLWNLRAALTVALSLPLTALIAFIMMDIADVTANLMSLGGLAIAIGMVVDGTIVVTENVVRHLSLDGQPERSSARVAFDATREVARPVLFAILIIVVVFLPLFTLEQTEGKMFRPLALTMVFAMLGSLVVALVIVPALTSLTLRRPRKRARGLTELLRRLYAPTLDLALRHRKATLGLAALLLAGALALVPTLGTEFMPALDEGAIAINVVRLPSASLEGSVETATLLERQLRTFPEVKTVVTKTGRAEISEDPMGPEQNDLFVMLHPEGDWTSGRSKAALIEAMQAKLSKVPGIRLSFSQPIALRVNEIISGIKSDVAVKIFGPDLAKLKETGERVGQVLNAIDGASDVRVEQISGFMQLDVEVDRRAIARYRLNIAEVNELIETAVGGKVATEVVEGQRRVAVQVRFPVARRRDAESIGRLLVATPSGAHVPLQRISRIREVEAPAQVSRQDGMRRIVAECNVRGRDLGGFVADLRQQLAPIQAALPVGYRVDIGGQFENQQRAMARLSWVVPLSIGLIFVFLFAAFGSIRSALMVIANLPFALVGGVVVLVLAKINLSVSAAVGFIALFGIAVENGVVLVTFFNQLVQRGHSVEEAVREGCMLRLRPLLMTTLTTLLGLSPMLFASGSGSEIQRPLAAVVLGGLVTSTALTLLVLPVIYTLVERGKGEVASS
jgi:cobalt-zinc-cadmium resistance protein CzcA